MSQFFSTTLSLTFAGGADERDELCPSMYSFHSSLEEKNQLLHTLTTYGIETTVDRSKKKDRIREWIQASAIVEENEEDESDVYEDSDEDEDNESDEMDPVPMRGRHFPERRPSAATNDRRKRRGSTASKKRVLAKPVERKIPFAPQVAEERETIARFASFPNGDPNLAVRNGNDQSRDTSATSMNADISPSTNGRSVKDPARTNVNNSQDESLERSTLPIKQSPPKTAPDSESKVAQMSPQIPTRKNRAHTAPFSDARSSEKRAESSTRRTQSATVLQSPEDPPLPPRTKTSASTARANHPSVAALSIPRTTRSAAPPVGRADRGAAAPTTGNAAPAETQPSSSAPSARVESSPPVAAQITMPTNAMSAASHLVMQSFNTLQDIAGNHQTSGTPSSTISPTSSSSNISKPAQRNEEMTVAYGKDAYAHYGIAHGAILPMRVNVVRQDSTGSGSRSVSN